MSNYKLRAILRLVHIVGGVTIIALIYSPWELQPLLFTTARFVVIPILGVTGVAMWQQARLSKLLKLNARSKTPKVVT
jgi:hypothetical protein